MVGAAVASLLAQDYPGPFRDRAGRRPQRATARRDRARGGGERRRGERLSVSARGACRPAGPASSGRSAKGVRQVDGARRRARSVALHRCRHRASPHATSPSWSRGSKAERRDLVSLMVRLRCQSLRRAAADPGLRLLLRHALSLRLGRTIRARRRPRRPAAACWCGASAYRAHRRLRRDPRRAHRRLRAGRRGEGERRLDLARPDAEDARACAPIRGSATSGAWSRAPAYAQLRYSPLLLAGHGARPRRDLSRAAAAGFRRRRRRRGSAAAAWAAMTLAYLPMLRFYGLSPLWAPLLPVASLVYLAATLRLGAALLAGRAAANGRAGSVAQSALTAGVETPSGKGSGDENFPVGSWLIRRELRPHVHAFYRFARQADDIADNPASLAADEKLRRLDRMGAVLDGAPGDDAPAAAAMRASLKETRRHAAALPRRAARLPHRRDQAALSRLGRADGVLPLFGRRRSGGKLLDLHGESARHWAASDALCSALQVLNHLQDCAEDYRALDRVYLPEQDLAACGSAIADLDAAALERRLARACSTACSTAPTRSSRSARACRRRSQSPGLRRECAVIVSLAERLARRLRRGDPLATRVELDQRRFRAPLLLGSWRGFAAGPGVSAALERPADDPRAAIRAQRRRGRHLVLLGDAASAAKRGARRCSRSMPSAATSTTSPTATTRRRRSSPSSARWRDEIDGDLCRHAAHAARRACSPPSPRTYRLRQEDFLAVIDGMEMDADADIRAPALAELDLYCDRVASAVGRLSVRIFGDRVARGRPRRRIARPRAAAHQHPARPRRGCRARPALSAARAAERARHHRTRAGKRCCAIRRVGAVCDAARRHRRASISPKRGAAMRAMPAPRHAPGRGDGRGLSRHPRPPAPARLDPISTRPCGCRSRSSSGSRCATACCDTTAPRSCRRRRPRRPRRRGAARRGGRRASCSTRRRGRPAAAAAPISTRRSAAASTTAIICCSPATARRWRISRAIGAARHAGRSAGAGLSLPRSRHRRALGAAAGNRGRVPWWLFDRARRVPGTRALDYLRALRLAIAGPDDDRRRRARPPHDALSAACGSRSPSPRSTPTPSDGSAALLARVCCARASAHGGSACRPLVPRDGLSESLVDPALAHLRATRRRAATSARACARSTSPASGSTALGLRRRQRVARRRTRRWCWR